MGKKSAPRAAIGAAATIPARRARAAHDTVVQGLGQAIVSGVHAAGDMLPGNDALLARFGVSRTTLREGLQTLAAKGLIAARTKIGTWVLDEPHWNMFDADILAWRLATGADRGFVASLFEIRQAFEPAAAALAALRITDADVARLRGHLAAMEAAAGDKARFTAADVAFHICILDASGNPLMRSIGALIATALAAAFALSAPTDDPALAENSRRQHAAILEALARRDPQAAADAMSNVISQGWLTYTHQQDQPLARLSLRRFLPA